MKNLILIFLLCFSTSLFAADKLYSFNNDRDANRYQHLIEQIRCVVCQGQNIADSNAPLANDLRHKILLMVNDNKTDTEIKNYLVDRYGEYILYQPRFNKLTFVLWSFPFLGIAVILIFIISNLFRSRHA